MDGMGMGDDGSGSMPLNHTGVDFSDPDQAADFLSSLLDDTELQVVGNTYAIYFWYGLVVVIGLATLLNIARWATLKMRLRYAAADKATPARPKSMPLRALATIQAIGRESTYPQWTPLQAAWYVRVPPFGALMLVAVHFAYVIALEFIGVDPAMYGDQYYQALSIKAAWLAIAQVPLLILLAGKNNIIGLLTGVSYERLNVLHRWTSRVLLLMATVHFGTESFSWNQFGLMQLEWSTDTCPPTGIAAYAILLWLNLSTVAPLRNWCYEFFVVQHVVTFFGFIIALMIHLPTTALTSRNWIYGPIALYFVDRLLRLLRYMWNNVRGSAAIIEPLDEDVTRVRVTNKAIKKWAPGSFVLLSLPRLAPGQSHPATIASTPTSHGGDLVFILKRHGGFTRTLQRTASKGMQTSQGDLENASNASDSRSASVRLALIDGPYGHHADFAAFDTTVLIAGATGITFTLPILLDIAHRATLQRLPVRNVVFLWLVKSRDCLNWVGAELRSAMEQLRSAGVEVTIRLCVTCDTGVTDADHSCPGGGRMAGCNCDTSAGPCCCVVLSDSDDEAEQEASGGKTADSSEENEKNPTSDGSKAESSNNSGPALTKDKEVQTTSGRPDLADLLWDQADQARGEMAVAVCGPLGLRTRVRCAVAGLSDARGVHKGTGAQGIYLHVEGFSF